MGYVAMNNQDEFNNLDISTTMKSKITAEVKLAESAEKAERVYEVKKVSLKKRHDRLDFAREIQNINNNFL